MIEQIEITGAGKYKIDDNFRKYTEKRLGRLDRYLPSKHKKNISAKVVVSQVNRAHGNKYEISVAIEVPGGKTMTARDEAANVFAGIDIIEAKLKGQIRRFKLEKTPHQQKPKKGLFKKVFFKKSA